MAGEKISKSEIAYKQVTVLGAKTLEILKTKIDLSKLENKVAVYGRVYGVLNVAIKLFLKQNINTFSNKLYFDVLRDEVLKTKTGYANLKGKILQKYQGESKYRYQLTKMNDLINEVEEMAQFLKKGKSNANAQSMVEKLSEIQKNVALRPLYVETIDLLPALEKARKVAIRTKHVEAIYKETIVPLMDFLVKEEALDAVKADKIKKHLLNVAKHGYVEDQDKKFDAKVSVKYWPKEVVLGDAEKFGYRGNVGLQFTETLTQGKTITTDFESSGDYISNFKLAVKAFKEGEKSTASKKVFYVYFLQRVLEDNKELAKSLSKLLTKIVTDLEKEGAKGKEVSNMKDSATEIGEIVETFYGSTYIFNIRRVKGEKSSHLRISIEETKDKGAEYEAPKPKVKKANPTKLPKDLQDL